MHAYWPRTAQPPFQPAPINMNTGDAEGDLYFDLRSVYTPLECAHPSPYTAVRQAAL